MDAEPAANKQNLTKGFAHVALFSAGLHVVLVALKFGLGVLCGSIALKADAFHSVADVLSSLGIFAGIKISQRQSKGFPYGLHKVENLTALITCSAIFFAAYEIIREVIFSEPSAAVSNVPVGILGLLFIMILTLLFSRYETKVGRRVGSPSLVADAKHIETDLLSTGGILLGLLMSLWHWNVDRYVAVIIALLIARLGWRILVDSLKVLLDASMSQDHLDRIRKVFYEFPQVKRVMHLRGRCSGRYDFLEAEAALDVDTLEEAHRISSAIEEEVYDRFPEVDKLLIHYEPMADQMSESTVRPLCPRIELTNH
ncbi:cation diffusion facilitator family transporter [Planctomycetota bacterium]